MMTVAEFDRLIAELVNTRKAANPLRYLCGILQRGEMLDPPPQRAALPQRRKVSNMPILTARVDPQIKQHYCTIFALARTADERVAVLESFEREVVAPTHAELQCGPPHLRDSDRKRPRFVAEKGPCVPHLSRTKCQSCTQSAADCVQLYS